MASRGILCLAFTLFLLPQVLPRPAAQSRRVIPSYCESFEGNAGENLVAGCEDMHKQMFYEGQFIAATRAVITALAFRRDGEKKVSYQAHTLHRMVTLDTVTKVSSLFANNLTAAAVKVYDAKNTRLPAAPVCTVPPAPFTVFFPFTRPYTYQPGAGKLLVDLLGIGTPKACRTWEVDNHFQNYGNSGMVIEYGKACTGSRGERLDAKVTPYKLHLGGTFELLFNQAGFQPGALAAWIGMSRDRFAGVPLPLDLAFLGAPGCTLQASMELVLPHGAAGGAFPPLTLSIPSTPALALGQLFCQAAAAAPGANGAGLVLSGPQHALVWPTQRPPTEVMTITAASSSAASGVSCYTPEGPVTAFFGSFQ